MRKKEIYKHEKTKPASSADEAGFVFILYYLTCTILQYRFRVPYNWYCSLYLLVLQFILTGTAVYIDWYWI